MTIEKDRQKTAEKYSYLVALLIFSVLCFGWAIFLQTRPPGHEKIKRVFKSEGGEIGPIEVLHDHTIFTFKVRIVYFPIKFDVFSTWSYVSGELLDSDKNFLLGFGGELWQERDENFYSRLSQDLSYEFSFVIPRRGTYYLKVPAEHGGNEFEREITVYIDSRRGSSESFWIMGAFSLLFCVTWFLGMRSE